MHRLSAILSALFTVVFVLLPTTAVAVTIDFDDVGAADGVLIGSFYSSLGVEFPNASWWNDGNFRPGASMPFQIQHDTLTNQPTPSDPIIIVFSSPMTQVSIDAIDVGFNDAQIDAYDAVSGGNLVDFDVYEGVTPIGNEGDPDDTHLLSVVGSGIWRIELYQPKFDASEDGLIFDNLTFVPEPSGASLFALGLLGLATRRRVARTSVIPGDRR